MAVTSGLRRAARNDCGEGYSQAALRGFAEGVPPGSNRQALPGLGFRAALLRVLRESRRAAGVVFVRISRRATPASFRCYLHRAAAREFLAGCFARLGKRPNLHSA